jgi:hypothetical protein
MHFQNQVQLKEVPQLNEMLTKQLNEMLTKQLNLIITMLFSDSGKAKNKMLRNISDDHDSNSQIFKNPMLKAAPRTEIPQRDDGWNRKSFPTIPEHSMIQSKRFSAELLRFDSFNYWRRTCTTRGFEDHSGSTSRILRRCLCRRHLETLHHH